MGKRHDHDDHCEEDESEKRLLKRIHLVLQAVYQLLLKIAVGCKPARPTVSFGFVVGQAKPKKKVSNMLELQITNEQEVDVTLAPVTDTGKPAPLDGSPAWTVISGNSQVIVAEDGKSAVLRSSDEPGDTEIMVKADANLGEGVEEISDIIRLSVVGATAKNLGLSAGAPRAKPTV